MRPEELQACRQFWVRQKITLMVNRYEVRVAPSDGTEGEIVAFAQQKRMAFRERVVFYTDESRSQEQFAFRARQVMDVGASYDVTDGAGRSLGSFRKKFKASLLRSTWQVEQPGLPEITGRERSRFLAVLRRIWEVLPFLGDLPFVFPYHFDFVAGDRLVMSVDKKIALRDRYRLDIADPGLDRRLAMAVAVALDALQGR